MDFTYAATHLDYRYISGEEAQVSTHKNNQMSSSEHGHHLKMFFQIDTSEFSSYAFDNTPFASVQNHEKLIISLQSTLNGVFEWYQENYFKANADKCHLFLSPFSNKEMTIANYKIASSNSEELLGVVIDSEVTFAKHIANRC